MESSGFGWNSVPQTISPTSDTWDGSKVEFLRLDQWVTKPAYYLWVQCGFLQLFFVLHSIQTVSRSHVANAVFAKKVTPKWKASRGGVLSLHDTKNTFHCHINPTVRPLSSSLFFFFFVILAISCVQSFYNFSTLFPISTAECLYLCVVDSARHFSRQERQSASLACVLPGE